MQKIICFLFYVFFSPLSNPGPIGLNGKPIQISNSILKKFPYSMLTPDYGIIKEQDLAEDYTQFQMKPFKDPPDPLPYWICISTQSTNVHFDRWKDSNPMGPSKKLIDLCSLEINVDDKEWGKHSYGGRRAKPLEYCENFVLNWKKLTQNVKIVCLGGEVVNIQKEKMGIHITWVWNKFRTQQGCYSNFNQCR